MNFLDEISSRFDVPYCFAPLPENCRAYLLDGVAILNDALTPEQTHWSYCHEVAHFLLNHHRNPPSTDAEEREQESDANQLAAEIMLPPEKFKPASSDTLKNLKRQFPHASHEVIARRRLSFRLGLLTIIDDGRITTRLAPDGWNRPKQLFPLESEALKTCMTEKDEVDLDRDGRCVEATYVDEGRGVIRVILFMEGDE
jgi:hypothetical protein